MKEFDDLVSIIHTLQINVAREKAKLKTKACNVNNSVNVNESKSKATKLCLKLPKFKLPNFYGEFNS